MGRGVQKDEEENRVVGEKQLESNKNNKSGCVNDYEAERARRIALNRARMQELGLGSGVLIGGGAECDNGYELRTTSRGAHEFQSNPRWCKK